MQPVTVDIKLPAGMTDDMFPLMLNMETSDRTLSPDATKNSIPVTAGKSIIDGKREELSYYYTVTIPTLEAYKALPNDGNMKVYSTEWLTNKVVNASTFYVDNKYFNQGSDSWLNYQYTFSNVSCSSSAVGEGKDVTISFTMADGAISKPVTISLVGMTYNGATVRTFTPSSKIVSISGFKTTTATDPVSFTLDADDYNIYGPVEGARQTYKFNGAFVDVTSLEAEKDVEVDFTFNISAEAFSALQSLYPDAGDAGVPMFVTLDRMHPADDQLVYSQGRANGDRYIYRIKQAGTQTIRLATTEPATGYCNVTLQTDYFDTETVRIYQYKEEITGAISFDNANQRTLRDNNKQVWTNGGITLTNEKNTSDTDVSDRTNPVRFYQNQSLKIEAPGPITKIVFNANSSAYATNLKNSIAGSSVSGNTVTVTMSGVTEFTIAQLTGDVRLNSISVTYKQ